MPRAMNHPDYERQSWSDKRRRDASDRAKERLGAPTGHSTVYGIHVPDLHAPKVRAAAVKIAAREGYDAAHKFTARSRQASWSVEAPVTSRQSATYSQRHPWSPQEDAALRREHFSGLTSEQSAVKHGREARSIALRKIAIKLQEPPAGCAVMPLKEVRKMVEGIVPSTDPSHLAAMMIAAYHFVGADRLNLAAYLGLNSEVVGRFLAKLKSSRVWNQNGPIEKNRYVGDDGAKGITEADLNLVLDAMLCIGAVSITPDGGWYMTEEQKRASRRA